MKVLAVTAADDKFFPLVCGTIASLRANSLPKALDIAVLDIGLQDWQRALLAGHVEHVVEPGWAIDFPGQATASTGLRALVARPFLRDLFPGYDAFLWIDADAWVQDPQALTAYLEAAKSRKLVITPEISRHYASTYLDPAAIRSREYQIYALGWGEALARRLVQAPLCNAGVFALHRESEAWGVWAETMRGLLQRTNDFYVEQTALNGAILTGRIPIVPLPAHCNWICHNAVPVIDLAAGELLEPGYPRQKLWIVHLTGGTKGRLVETSTSDGRPILTSLHYPHAKEYLRGRDYVSPGLKPINLAPCFPYMTKGNPSGHPWPYLRREYPHPWYVDSRSPTVGFLNCDEAHILFNSALKVAGRRALEIGCFLGWSVCHLAAAGVQLDVIDPLLARPDFRSNVETSLAQAGLRERVNLIGGASPAAVDDLIRAKGGGWSFVFIDGDHEDPGPYRDAVACEPHCAEDALVLFHDLAAPAVSRGLDHFRERGWKTAIYNTTQIMGVAWRGALEPVEHIADPSLRWTVPDHLAATPVLSATSAALQRSA
jgi:predicted O-methyltransferase YrrM